MDPEVAGSGASEAPSMRPYRAAAVVVLALVGMAVAGVVYLRSNSGTAAGASATSPAPVSRDPVSYYFISPKTGWAVLNPLNPASSPSQFRVFRTTDGGQHWRLQLQGLSVSPGFMPVTVHMFGATAGYMTIHYTAIGEGVYRTDDGGNTWRSLTLPARVTPTVVFSDAGYGWALVQANALAGQLFHLYESSDGGTTWQSAPDPPGDASGLALRGPTEAWMGSVQNGAPHVYESTDSGRSWQRFELASPPGQTWDAGSYQTDVELLPSRGLLVTTAPGFIGATQSDLFTSFSAGIWTHLPPPPGGISFEDATDWWAINDTALWKSADAGQVWMPVSNDLPAWQFVPHVLDSKHAWAELTVAGGFGLGLTSDGGRHWTRGNVPSAPASAPAQGE